MSKPSGHFRHRIKAANCIRHLRGRYCLDTVWVGKAWTERANASQENQNDILDIVYSICFDDGVLSFVRVFLYSYSSPLIHEA